MFLQSWSFYLNLLHTFHNMDSSVWIYFFVEHPVVTNFILTSSWPVKLCDFFWSRFSKIVLKCTNLEAYNSIKQNKLHVFKRHSFFENLKIWVWATKLVTNVKFVLNNLILWINTYTRLHAQESFLLLFLVPTENEIFS